MNRIFRMRRFSKKQNAYETLFPQTVTRNVLRADNGGVLESYLHMYDKHLDYPVPHLNRAFSFGTHRHLIAFIPKKELVDNFPLLLTLHTELDAEPTLNFNNTGPKPIVNAAGERIPGGQIPGAILFMVYSEKLDSWMMLSNDNYSDITRVMTPVLHDYYYTVQANDTTTVIIPGFNRKTMRLDEINYGQTVLAYGLDYDFEWARNDTIHLKRFAFQKGDVIYFKWTSYNLVAKKGHIKYDVRNKPYYFEIAKDGDNQIKLPEDFKKSIAYDVNYGQTVLREGLDYIRDEEANTIDITGFDLVKGDIIVINAIEMIESDGDLLPNNWGTTGTHRYAVDVQHGEFTAEKNGTTLIPIPGFNHRRDSITMIRDNKVLVFDVDYTVDLLDNVILLADQHLDRSQTIYYTVMHGALIDVPNYNVITASGSSGQHILVDIHDSQICDFYTLVIKLTHDLETAPTIKCINGPARPVADCFGSPVTKGYKKGSFLWVVYNEELKTWYSLGHGQLDITSKYPSVLTNEGDDNFFGDTLKEYWYGDEHKGECVIEHNLGVKPTVIDILPNEPPQLDDNKKIKPIGDIWAYADEKYLYVGNTGTATSGFHWRVSNTDKTVDLTAYLEQELQKLRDKTPDLTTSLQVFTATEHTNQIPIRWYNPEEDILLVNYGQTILRENLDFERRPWGVQLTKFYLEKNDIIQVTVVKQD